MNPYPLKVMIVDDEPSARLVLRGILRELSALQIFEVATLAEARQTLTQVSIDIATVDLRLIAADPANRDGLSLIRELRQRHRAVPIVVSGYDEMAEIRAAMRSGAYDYFIRREICSEIVVPVIEELRQRFALEREVLAWRAQAASTEPPYGMLGTSTAMTNLRGRIERLAAAPEAPVLILGKTGCGKELVARAIHRLSRPVGSPFFDLNCAALPDSLIEAELFGHEKGAYTGAERRREGCFAAAGEGTLFLDEIGELPLPMQAKLLRVLDQRRFRPVGAAADRPFHGRVLAATHRDMEDWVRQGRFREDLFHRLDVLRVLVPALDEHREDIPGLIAHFAGRAHRPLRFLPEAIAALQERAWPGNVRQLRNVVERLAVFSESDEISLEALGRIEPGTAAAAPGGDPVDAARALARALLCSPVENKLEAAESALIEEAMAQTGGTKAHAARLLGVHRKVIERRLRGSDPE